MKVAAVQFRPEFKDRKGNIKRLALLVQEAAAAGSKLIVLPELCTTGYSFMGAEDAHPFAETLQYPAENSDSSSFTVFRALSRRLGVHIVWGVMERSLATGKLFNSQVIVCPDGTFESYSKVNFFANDFLWATPGRANPPVLRIDDNERTRKVGLLICRDVRDKKDSNWSSFYEAGDADVVCLSANWGDGGFPATAWMDFASDNKVTLVVSNRYGQEVNNNFGEGGVCLISPTGAVMCQGLVWSQDCIVYGEV